jgi:hypothetical protein
MLKQFTRHFFRSTTLALILDDNNCSDYETLEFAIFNLDYQYNVEKLI